MTKSPPVPPANRSPHAGTQEGHPPKAGKGEDNTDLVPENLDQQDRQGNVKQNTTHQGYQQNR